MIEVDATCLCCRLHTALKCAHAVITRETDNLLCILFHRISLHYLKLNLVEFFHMQCQIDENPMLCSPEFRVLKPVMNTSWDLNFADKNVSDNKVT